MTEKRLQALRNNAALARRKKWVNNATNKQLAADGSQDAKDELWRRNSCNYYLADDPRRKHWES